MTEQDEDGDNGGEQDELIADTLEQWRRQQQYLTLRQDLLSRAFDGTFDVFAEVNLGGHNDGIPRIHATDLRVFEDLEILQKLFKADSYVKQDEETTREDHWEDPTGEQSKTTINNANFEAQASLGNDTDGGGSAFGMQRAAMVWQKMSRKARGEDEVDEAKKLSEEFKEELREEREKWLENRTESERIRDWMTNFTFRDERNFAGNDGTDAQARLRALQSTQMILVHEFQDYTKILLKKWDDRFNNSQADHHAKLGLFDAFSGEDRTPIGRNRVKRIISGLLEKTERIDIVFRLLSGSGQQRSYAESIAVKHTSLGPSDFRHRKEPLLLEDLPKLGRAEEIPVQSDIQSAQSKAPTAGDLMRMSNGSVYSTTTFFPEDRIRFVGPVDNVNIDKMEPTDVEISEDDLDDEKTPEEIISEAKVEDTSAEICCSAKVKSKDFMTKETPCSGNSDQLIKLAEATYTEQNISYFLSEQDMAELIFGRVAQNAESRYSRDKYKEFADALNRGDRGAIRYEKVMIEIADRWIRQRVLDELNKRGICGRDRSCMDDYSNDYDVTTSHKNEQQMIAHKGIGSTIALKGAVALKSMEEAKYEV